MPKTPIARCGFCDRPRNEVKNLISGSDDGPFICNRCLEQGFKALQASAQQEEGANDPPLPKPREIKAILDQHVIAQERAKTDTAVAVYQHYKRREAAKKGLVPEGIDPQKSNILLLGPSGCHRKGQKVLMFDGSFKVVEDVRVGDLLMGPDSTPRRVQELHHGTEAMVEIIPNKGVPWVVNKGHILTLVRTSRSVGKSGKRPKRYRPVSETTDVWLDEYLKWSRTQKSIHKLFRVGVTFEPGPALPLDSYFLGVLLGDGCLCRRVGVTNIDPEVVAEVYAQAKKFKLHISIEGEGTTSATYHLSGKHGGGNGRGPEQNPIQVILKGLDLFGCDSGSKFIPFLYKTASSEDRLNLLAGLIDTDGDYKDTDNCYYFTSKSYALASDFTFVARSLGFAAYLKPTRKCDQNGTWGDYFRVTVSGEVDRIPVRVQYKKARRRQQPKDVLRVGFKTRELPPDEYFGFVLDGDHRYLLDDFTVTHNTGKTELARTVARMLRVPFHVGDATRLTQAGYVGDDVETLLQGLVQAADGDVERAQWGIIFLDEIDKLARKSGRGATGFRDVTGEGVQQALLKLLEGASVVIPQGNGKMVISGAPTNVIDTSNILFIGAGSFSGIEEVIKNRVNKTAGIGFGAGDRKKLTLSEVYSQVTEDDVLEFGLIPELMGRLPIITTTLELSEDEMVRILTEPKNSLVKQFEALYQMDGISLQFDEGALRAIGREAKKRPTGARALRSIIESVLNPYSFDLPSDPSVTSLRVTEGVVAGTEPAVVMRKTAATA